MIASWRTRATAGCAAAFVTATSPASAAERLRFWNLTTVTLVELYLAPAGTTAWGANQCKNDRDGAVDSDERLTIKDVEPGRYDVKLADKDQLHEVSWPHGEAQRSPPPSRSKFA